MQYARFLTLADVAETLNISGSQAYALVRTGELEAIKIGGRGQWRVEADKLEDFIRRMYDRARSVTDPAGSAGVDAAVLGEWEVRTAKE
jgi:excisionase family DNA binding protein